MPSFLNKSLGLPPAIPADQDPASGAGDFQEVWSSIKKGGDQELGKISSADVWGAILSEKAEKVEENGAYVHPLVKRSGSCLSEKSLEICTESLGSETGADGFSTEEKIEDVVVIEDEEKPVSGVRLYGAGMRKVGIRSASVFPPPLPSLGGGGGNVRMMSHRENGRLLLEAVSVPSRNCLRAEREGGRLLLTFDDDDCEEDDDDEAIVVVEKEMKVETTAIVMKTGVGVGSMLNVDYKFLCLTKSSWSNRFNIVVNSGGDDDKEKDEKNRYIIPSGGSLNKYVYSWRTPKPMLEATSGVVVVEAVKAVDYKYDELLPLLRGCNKLKDELLLWDTAQCIVSRS